eukprot:3974025-Prymnesium_polylepis.1
MPEILRSGPALDLARQKCGIFSLWYLQVHFSPKTVKTDFVASGFFEGLHQPVMVKAKPRVYEDYPRRGGHEVPSRGQYRTARIPAERGEFGKG